MTTPPGTPRPKYRIKGEAPVGAGTPASGGASRSTAKQVPPERLVHVAKVCNSCGYSLAGVPVGAPCPECGTPIPIVKPRDDSLVHAPRQFLERLALACVVLAITGPVAFVFDQAADLLAPLFGGGRTPLQVRLGITPAMGPSLALRVCCLLASSFWLWGVFVATLPRRSEHAANRWPARENIWLRRAARASQCLWPIAAFLAGAATIFETVGHPATEAIASASFWAGLLAFFGLGVLAWCLSTLANWGNDTDLARRFNTCGVGLAIAGPAIVCSFALARAFDNIIFAGIGVIATLALIAGVVLFAIALLQTQALARAALTSKQAGIERDKRLLAKAEGDRLAQKEGRRTSFERRLEIGEHTPCPGCGFDVIGLKYGQPCPECARPIGE